MSTVIQSAQGNALQQLYAERMTNKIQKVLANWNAQKIPELNLQLQQMLDASSTIGLSTIHMQIQKIYTYTTKLAEQNSPPSSEQDEYFRKHLAILENIVKSQTLALRALLSHDQITGLPNRTKILERLDIELSRAIGKDDDLCFSLVRIDPLQPTLGESAEQAMLQTLATLLQQYLRKFDIIGHFTTNSLAIILTDTELDQAAELMQEIKNIFASLQTQENTAVTISIAIVEKFPLSNAVTLSAAARKLIDEQDTAASFSLLRQGSD